MRSRKVDSFSEMRFSRLSMRASGCLGQFGLLGERCLALVELPLAGFELLSQRLAGDELLFACLELLSQPAELVALGLLELRLAPLEVGLLGVQRLLAALDLGEAGAQLAARLELRLAQLQVGLSGDQRLLAALDLGEAGAQLLNLGAGRCELLLELVVLRANSLVPVTHLGLASPEGGVLGGDPRAFLGQALLALRES